MKFFTRQLYRNIQPDSGVEDEAGRRWDENVAAYQRHLDAIKPQLPPRVCELARTTFHDAVVGSVDRPDSTTVILRIDARNSPWTPSGEYLLTFFGVVEAEGLDEVVDDDWLYEEVHLHAMARFEYRVLLSGREFRIAANDVSQLRLAHAMRLLVDKELYARLKRVATNLGITTDRLASVLLAESTSRPDEDLESTAVRLIEKYK